MRIIVHVTPNSRERKLEAIEEGKFHAWLKSPPVKGKANKELVKMLQEHFKTKNVKIISGHASRIKHVEIIQNS
ncbi:MAG: DUF167 domain-containing protein [Candidatus Helarchaeales archaeon]